MRRGWRRRAGGWGLNTHEPGRRAVAGQIFTRDTEALTNPRGRQTQTRARLGLGPLPALREQSGAMFTLLLRRRSAAAAAAAGVTASPRLASKSFAGSFHTAIYIYRYTHGTLKYTFIICTHTHTHIHTRIFNSVLTGCRGNSIHRSDGRVKALMGVGADGG